MPGAVEKIRAVFWTPDAVDSWTSESVDIATRDAAASLACNVVNDRIRRLRWSIRYWPDPSAHRSVGINWWSHIFFSVGGTPRVKTGLSSEWNQRPSSRYFVTYRKSWLLAAKLFTFPYVETLYFPHFQRRYDPNHATCSNCQNRLNQFG